MTVRALDPECPEALRIPVTILGQALRQCDGPVGLTPAQAGVLSQLTAAPLSVSALARSQGIAVSTMTEIVGRMQERGYVVKQLGEDDRRRVDVSITELGRESLASVLVSRDELLRHRLARLSADELERLRGAVDVLWLVADLDMMAWPRFEAANWSPAPVAGATPEEVVSDVR